MKAVISVYQNFELKTMHRQPVKQNYIGSSMISVCGLAYNLGSIILDSLNICLYVFDLSQTINSFHVKSISNKSMNN